MRQTALGADALLSILDRSSQWEVFRIGALGAASGKDSACADTECYTLQIYLWDRSETVEALVIPGKGLAYEPAIMAGFPGLTQSLAADAAAIALADAQVRELAGPDPFVVNVASFIGSGQCEKQICGLASLVTPSKAKDDGANGVSVQVNLASRKIVLVVNHAGIFRDLRFQD